MAKVIAETTDGFLVEMSRADAKRVSADVNITVGDDFELPAIYNKLAWIGNNKQKIQQLSSELRGYAAGLDNVLNVAGI